MRLFCTKWPITIRHPLRLRHLVLVQHIYSLLHLVQHTATQSNTLQHTATQSNTLQHTAIHCNKLWYTCKSVCNIATAYCIRSVVSLFQTTTDHLVFGVSYLSSDSECLIFDLSCLWSARPYESCKIFKGRPRRNAFSKLVHRQYKSFPPDRFCQVEIQNTTGLSNKPSTA